MDFTFQFAGLGVSFGCASDWRPGGRGIDPHLGRQYSFVEIDHERNIFCGHSFPAADLRRKLSISGERMCTLLVNCLED